MADVLRLTLMIGSFIAVALMAVLQQPQLAQDLRMEQWKEDALQHVLFSESAAEGKIDDQDRNILNRIANKSNITEELIAGRITLFEAAARFRELNEKYPVDRLAGKLSGATDEEWLCAQVIRWVRSHMAEHPGAASEDFAERLERELLCHKQRYGNVVLP